MNRIDLNKAKQLASYLKEGKFPEAVDQMAQKITEEVSANIDCLSCANCCKTSPPLIIAEDIRRISKHLGISKKQFRKKYILEDVNGEDSFSQVPCVFLLEDNSCSIYDIRPNACRRYPHTDESSFYRLRKLHARNVTSCPIAFEVVKKIKTISNNQSKSS